MKQTSIKIHPLPNDANTEPLKKEIGQLSVDIYHKDKEIVILAPIAGVTKDDVKLSVTDDVLVIRGQRPLREEVPEDNYYTKECFWGNFSRAIVLPKEADSKNISASFDNNMLEVRIPKNEIEHTKIIKIKA
ncbi:MAG: Hsp20/alpha crystallin family protein [Patescibacteria group bacterium]